MKLEAPPPPAWQIPLKISILFFGLPPLKVTHIFQVLVNIVLIGCISMTDILDNPFGFNKDYDINLKEVCSCLFKSEGISNFRCWSSTSGGVLWPFRSSACQCRGDLLRRPWEWEERFKRNFGKSLNQGGRKSWRRDLKETLEDQSDQFPK